MKKIAMLATTAVVVIAGSTVVMTDESVRRGIREFLNGHKEQPVISTTGRGTFTAAINKEGTEIEYKLQFSDLEGNVTQAHIHIGHPQNTGGISVWLCSNLASPPTPVGVPRCTPPAPALQTEGEVEGIITAEDVVGPTGQGFDVGEFDALLAAIRAGVTYVNVHSTKWPAGEIRSQIDHHGQR